MIYFVSFTQYVMTRAVFCFLLFSASYGNAQPTDSSLVNQAVENTISLYHRQIAGHALLYLGSEFQEPEISPEQHPFFVSNDWTDGSVTYRGQKFTNVPLLYDITSDRIITENFYSAQQIVLVREKVTDFDFGERHFKNIKTEGSYAFLPAPGFYEVIYHGPSVVLARHTKNIREDISDQRIETFFDERSRYFILRHDRYFPVRNKASVLRVFGKKQELKQLIKKEKLSFRLDPIRFLERTASQFDTLNPAR